MLRTANVSQRGRSSFGRTQIRISYSKMWQTRRTICPIRGRRSNCNSIFADDQRQRVEMSKCKITYFHGNTVINPLCIYTCPNICPFRRTVAKMTGICKMTDCQWSIWKTIDMTILRKVRPFFPPKHLYSDLLGKTCCMSLIHKCEMIGLYITRNKKKTKPSLVCSA